MVGDRKGEFLSFLFCNILVGHVSIFVYAFETNERVITHFVNDRTLLYVKSSNYLRERWFTEIG